MCVVKDFVIMVVVCVDKWNWYKMYLVYYGNKDVCFLELK